MKTDDKLKRSDERKKLIVDTAKNCFGQHGFHGTSMSELLIQTGLSAGQLYRYFPGKDILILEVVRSIAKEWREFLSARLSQDTALHELLDVNSAFWAGWNQCEHSLLLESYSEASRNEDVRRILKDEEEKTIIYLVKRNAKNEEESVFNRERVRLLLTIIDGFICRVVYDIDLEPQELARLDVLVFGERKTKGP
ncbi:TetR/AcrR family transcriptional regulator [Klebsiella oxytoca]|uniref:TetR/AcrR family transcriptional regulator n=1 Tax=Klebsiella oxytoca TaxID=571 RepID=UPI003570EDAD|nr:TetR/AcrR family transcriptional regulator [Klebsiella oxytoca]HCB2157576.1 TetR/AcrR family transcriptional regulator [Klebsiella oxytoca]